MSHGGELSDTLLSGTESSRKRVKNAEAAQGPKAVEGKIRPTDSAWREMPTCPLQPCDGSIMEYPLYEVPTEGSHVWEQQDRNIFRRWICPCE